MPEQDKLSHFLIKLSDDPHLSQQFRHTPLETMTAAGLTDAQKHVVLSGNAAKLSAALRPALKVQPGAAAGGDTTVVVVVVVVV